MADSNRKGAFELSNVRQRSLDGFWETGLTNVQYAWTSGGLVGATSVERLDFSNDTATASSRTTITGTRYQSSGVSNNNAGWLAGNGNASVAAATVLKIVFASDTVTPTTRGSLLTGVAGSQAAGNANYGWVIGGWTGAVPTFPATSLVQRITYSNDSASATSRAPMIFAKSGGAAVTDGTFAWVAGGSATFPSTAVSTVSKVDFSSDANTILQRGPLASARYGTNGAGNTNYGWLAGGTTSSAVERIDFSNDIITASVRGPLSAIKAIAGSANNQNYGWFMGGFPASTSSIFRIDFSNDTSISSTRGILTIGRQWNTAVQGIAGYPQYPGSAAGAANATINGFGWVTPLNSLFANTSFERIDFSNDSVAASTRGTLTTPRSATAFNNSNYGFLTGGAYASLIERLDFANDLLGGRYRGSLGVTVNAANGSGNANYGWLSGGTTPNSNVQRVDFSNDGSQTSPRGNLVIGRFFHTATGNVNYGWHASGLTPGAVSSVERIDYSNDLATAITRGSLLVSRDRAGSTANTAYGWFVSGGFSSPVTSIDRIDFSNDSVSAVSRGNVPLGRAYANGAGNADYGWFSGGYATPAYKTTIDRITYANDTATAATRGPLTVARSAHSAASTYVKEVQRPLYGVENGTYGWFAHGSNSGYSAVERIDFANDTAATTKRATTQLSKTSAAGTSNNSFGWFSAGRTGTPTPSTLSSVERLDLSNDLLITMPRSITTISKLALTGAGNSNYGWLAGGTDVTFPRTVIYSTVERMTYASDTIIPVTRGTLSIPRANSAATSNSNYGWFAGGFQSVTSSPTQVVASVDRVDFANDLAVASTRGPIVTAVYGQGATGNNNFGWFVGGYKPIPAPLSQAVTTVNRIEYANDSVFAITRGQLSIAVDGWSGTGNNNYGWFNRDQSVLRIDFSNDSVIAATRGSLTGSRLEGNAISNYVKDYPANNIAQYNIGTATVGTGGGGTYGWFGGGRLPPSTIRSSVERIDFSNDIALPSFRGSLSLARYDLSAIGNNNYGWFAGGSGSGSPSLVSTIDRLNFTNDTVAALLRGPLSVATQSQSAVGNNNYGWLGGGGFVSGVSTIERIDFNNDSPTATSIRGPLSSSRYFLAATGNANFGWFGGGYNAGAAGSLVDRITFANDSVTAISRGTLSVARNQLAATGNANYGWWAGGRAGGPGSSRVDRVDWSNDSPTASARSPLSSTKYGIGAIGNANFGWFTGSESASSSVDRIDFANDTAAVGIRGPLNNGRRGAAGVSNYTK